MNNLISWVEIPAKNFERATEFYNKVLNLKLEVADYGIEKMACFPGGEGAISFAPNFEPSSGGVLVSLNASKQFDAVLKRIAENGGEVKQGKTKIQAEGRGYFATFLDTEGNKLSLYGG